MVTRFTKIFVLTGFALAVTAWSGAAATPARMPILGVVPHSNQLIPAPHLLSKVIRTHGPATLTFDPNYVSVINQYFTDVAHDSNTAQNVYSVATQYSVGSGAIRYQSTFGGSYIDHDPLPVSACDDFDPISGLHDPYCLTNHQLRNEIQKVLTAKGWHGGNDHVFFLMTPNGVGSCSDAFSGECSTNAFCAYHSYFKDLKGEPVIYADEPYEGPYPGCADPTQGFPNDPDGDTTVNTISHEHNEAITDPFRTGWLSNDRNQDENGDLCAYGFGSPLGGTPGVDAYNQVINGHHYDLQQEWSNTANGCVQRPGPGTATQPPCAPPPPQGTLCSGPLVYHNGPVMHTNTVYAIYWLPTTLPAVTKVPHISGRARVGKKLSGSHGSWMFAPTFAFQWLRCNAHGASCKNIPHATHATYKLAKRDAKHRLRLRVTATNAAGSMRAISAATARVGR